MIELDDFDDIDLPEEPPKDPDECLFDHCSNKATGTISYTNGKQYGKVKVCDACFDRNMTERPRIDYYVCGQLMLIESIWFPQEK